MNIQFLLPTGVARLLDYWKRLRELGLPGHAALDRKYRNALTISNLEIIPQEIIGSLDLVVDVGANAGDWSLACALLTKARQIIAYEPLPQVYGQLVQKARLHPQIVPKQIAIGEKQGEVAMNIERSSELSSILELRQELRDVHGLGSAKPQRINVRMSTLDSELTEYKEISLLKLDVQGYEPQVIAGARSILPRVRALLTEVTFHPYYDGDMQFLEFCQLLTSASDLRLWGVSCPRCSSSGQPLWADAVFVRKC